MGFHTYGVRVVVMVRGPDGERVRVKAKEV
jgi:hypothetical protein